MKKQIGLGHKTSLPGNRLVIREVMSMKKNWIKIASIYIGTVIGAGFASGREIIEFFGVYGVKGILGFTISGLLFAIIGSLLLIKMYSNSINNLNELIDKVFVNKFGLILNTIISLALYTGYGVMIAGSGAIFKEELGLSFNSGMMAMIVFTFIVFLFKLEGLSTINSILVPLLIAGILFTSIYLNIREGYIFSNIEGAKITSKGNFLTSALLYFGTNSLVTIIVFSSLLPLIDSKKTAILGGTVGGIILLILGVSILTSMLIYYNEVVNLEIPMLKISDSLSDVYRKLYAIILWIAIFTTAIANGFGFINRLSESKYSLLYTVLFCVLAMPLAKIGFSNLVSIIYPISGAIGVVLMLFILIYL